MVQQGFRTCLWFDHQAEEAARFYTGIFPASELGRVVRYSEAGPREPGMVMVVEFTMNGEKFMALNGGPEFTFNEAVSFNLACDSQEEVDYYWNALLADGGEPVQCGWLKDKFGVSWQVEPAVLMDMVADPDPEKARRVTEAMLPMVKLDLSTLQHAYDGV